MAEGGVCVLHFVYHNPDLACGWRVWLKRGWRRLTRKLRPVPQMQMNAYPLNAVFQAVQESSVRRMHVELTDHGGCQGVLLFFRKCPGDSYIA